MYFQILMTYQYFHNNHVHLYAIYEHTTDVRYCVHISVNSLIILIIMLIFSDGLVNTNMTSVNNFLMIRLWYIYINVRKCIPHKINDW
jgi:hypothetical protein